MRAHLARTLARFRWLAVGRRGAFAGGRCMLCDRPALSRREGRVCDLCDAVLWGRLDRQVADATTRVERLLRERLTGRNPHR